MAIVNPLLLATADQVLAYQESRVKEWTEQRGENKIDFDHYFEEIAAQWELDDFYDTSVNIDQFNDIDGIDTELSATIRTKLTHANLLDSNGFINLKDISDASILAALNEFSDDELSPEQKASITATLNALKTNKPTDFETFTKGMFTTTPALEKDQKYAISESESHAIWDALNQNGAINDFGVLLLKTHSEELESVIYRIGNITDDQKKRVFVLLNQHPELSYHAYIQKFNQQTTDGPKSVGIYVANGANMKQEHGLTQEQLNYIKVMAVLEWNIMIMSQKSIHKSRKKSVEKVKKQKKEDQQSNEKYMAQLEAKYRAMAKKGRKKTK